MKLEGSRRLLASAFYLSFNLQIRTVAPFLRIEEIFAAWIGTDRRPGPVWPLAVENWQLWNSRLKILVVVYQFFPLLKVDL